MEPSGIVVHDFDNSGRPDAAVSAAHLKDSSPRPEPAFVSIHRNTNADIGGFITHKVSSVDLTTNVTEFGRRLSLGSFNPGAGGDSHLDAAAALALAHKVTVSLGNGDGTFQAPITIEIDPNPPVDRGPRDLTVGDIGGDGDSDVVTADASSGTDYGMTWINNDYSGSGNPTFTTHQLPGHPTESGWRPQCVLLYDYTGSTGNSPDGLVDLIEGAFKTDSAIPPTYTYKIFTYRWIPIVCYPGPPPHCTVEHFELDRTITLNNSPHDIEAALLDNGTKVDLAVALRGLDPNLAPIEDNCVAHPTSQYRAGGVAIIKNVADTLSTVTYLLDTTSTLDPRNVVIADLVGDSQLDVAVPTHCNDGLSIWQNNGSMSFSLFTHYDAGSWPNSIEAADFDLDGLRDIVVTCYHSNNVAFYKKKTDGTFATPLFVGVGTENYFVDVGNLDEDANGRIDFVTINSESDNLSAVLNLGP